MYDICRASSLAHRQNRPRPATSPSPPRTVVGSPRVNKEGMGEELGTWFTLQVQLRGMDHQSLQPPPSSASPRERKFHVRLHNPKSLAPLPREISWHRHDVGPLGSS